MRSRRLRVREEPDTTIPRKGDTLVTLSCDGSMPLERRMDLLSYAFAKAIQGAVLRQIIKWDLANGCLKFIVGEGANVPGPRGRFCAELAEIPNVSSKEEPFKPTLTG